MQKRAARIILEAERTTKTVTMFNELQWVLFYIEAYINRCGIAYKRINRNTQDYINDILKSNSDVHTRNTRYSNINLICQHYNKISDGGRTFTIRTIKDWNNLRPNLKKSQTFKLFKRDSLKCNLDAQKTNNFFNDMKQIVFL